MQYPLGDRRPVPNANGIPVSVSIRLVAPAPAAARCHATTGSPIGPLTLAAAAGCLTGLYPDAHRHGPGAAALGDSAAAPFAAAACQLAGVGRKQFLLDIERRQATARPKWHWAGDLRPQRKITRRELIRLSF